MTSKHRDPDIILDHVVIAGVGLIGGSIAKTLKRRPWVERVTGLGRNRERLLQAQRAGIIDAVATSPEEIGEYDIAVVCTPVDRIVDDVRSLAAVAPPGALITDAGSVKEGICTALSDVKCFIGSHPMAGSELGGWEHSSDDLFRAKTCVITPTGQSQKDVGRIWQLWALMQMQICLLPPEEHDRFVALTSHLPHAVAAVLASMLTLESEPVASTGFRDTTRVASGDPDLWTAIFRNNREAVSKQLEALIENLEWFHEALRHDNSSQIRSLLTKGRDNRDQWLSRRPDLRPPTGPSS